MPELVPAMPGSSGVLELLPPGPMGLPKTWRMQWEAVGQAGAVAFTCGGCLGRGCCWYLALGGVADTPDSGYHGEGSRRLIGAWLPRNSLVCK